MPQTLHILLLYVFSDYYQDVKQSILQGAEQQGDKVEIHTCDVSQNWHQTIPNLHQFQIIFLDACGSEFYNHEKLGNLIADFSLQGGGVVVCLFSHMREQGNKCLGGTFEKKHFHPFEYTKQSYMFNTNTWLDMQVPGTKLQHPILSKVTSFDGGNYSGHFAPCELQAGASAVCYWNDHSPLVAEKQNYAGTGMVVACNFTALSSRCRGQCWNEKTDGAQIMYNACTYAYSQWKQYRKEYTFKLHNLAKKYQFTCIQIVLQ